MQAKGNPRQPSHRGSHARQLPPSRIDGTIVEDSIIADGCYVRAKSIKRSIIGVRARIGPVAAIEDSIIMGNDFTKGTVPFEIGANCRIRRAIIDKNVVLGEGCVLENARGVERADTDLYAIRAGVVVVPKGTVIPPGTTI